MAEDLAQLRDALRQGQKLSQQTSLERRAPAPESVPFLQNARSGLRRIVAENPNSVEAWRLLSEAEECLLDYSAALRALHKAMELSGKRDKRDLKRVALLREAGGQWTNLGLTPAQLADLGRYLEERLGGGQGERSLRFTREWLERSQPQDPKRTLEALDRRGAFTDFQVLYNVVRG